MKIPRGRMTDVLAAVTFALFLLVWLLGRTDYVAVAGGFVPARVGDPTLYANIGGPIGMLPVWITPLSATLIHGGWLHIGFNLLMLLFCGRHVEHVLGMGLAALLYVAGAYAAAAAEYLTNPGGVYPMVGASGAISALLGTYALLYSQQKVRSWGPFSANVVRIAWLAAGWVVVQLMIGYATADGESGLGHIAVAAHIGGFLIGLLLTRPLLQIRFRKSAAVRNQR